MTDNIPLIILFGVQRSSHHRSMRRIFPICADTILILHTATYEEPAVRVYLDNCCFNRPFDDQRQTRVRLEAEAKLCIQEHIRGGTLELAWSYILDFENAANPFEERRTMISEWRQYTTIDVEETTTILQDANALVGLGLKAKDALHIACAIAGECAYFLTTDDDILRRGRDVQGITVLDPTAFVREMNL